MTKFDFHNLLSPTEFENLCRDILEIRENKIKFTTYGPGKDGGIDIKSTNTKEKIIGQCKLYAPHNYSGLLSSLNKEVDKCKRLKADRYILCININLTPTRASEIKNIFGEYIHYEEDIIDGIKLNKYLNQKPYEYLLKSYSKLLIPNFKSIELALENVIDRAINKPFYEDTHAFLLKLKEKRKLFHHTSQIPHLINQLEKNKVIILSGNPGVGKTTTAMIIANYFLSKKVNDIVFLQEDFDKIRDVKSDNRLVIVDDFWGQNFSPRETEIYSTYQRKFQRTIESFSNSKNQFLILTSRDYVIQDVLNKNIEPETKDLLNNNKYIINLEENTIEDKVKILMNHLLFYDFNLSYFSNALYDDNFEFIIKHRNYSPRHLDFFIKTYLNEDLPSSHTFYKDLKKYLDNPTTFWNETFQKLNPTSKAILLTLLVSGGIMNLEDLKSSFDDIQIKAREILNENIIPIDFYKELKKLEEFYISINKNEYYNDILIEFQSPGIKDYLLEFLRSDGYLWIHPFILKAKYINQLTFLFSTKKEEVSDYESDTPLFGEKILLKQNFKELLKQKLLLEFEDLNFCNHEEIELTDQLTRYHSAKETKYFKLIELNNLFPIYIEENKDVKKFIIEKVLIDIENYDGKIVDSRSMIYFPNIIKLVFPYLDYSPNEILKVYYNSITFASEYNYFYSFKDIFPKEFKHLYDSEIKKIRNHIKELIFDDIDYYLCEEDGYIGDELDSLISWEIEELKKQYNFRITEKFLNNLEATFEIDLSNLRKKKKLLKKRKDSKKEKTNIVKCEPKPYEKVIEEYLPFENDSGYSPNFFLKKQGFEFLSKSIYNKESALFSLKDKKEIFEPLCHFIVNNNIEVDELDTYQIIDKFFIQHCNQIGISTDSFTKIIINLLEKVEQSNDYIFTKSTIFRAIDELKLYNLNKEVLNPFIISYKNWYKFSHQDIEVFFCARHINSFSGKQFSKLITESLIDPDGYNLLIFLQSIDKQKLWNYYIHPEIERLICHINFTNQQKMLSTFFKFFNVEFNLEWDNTESVFKCYSSSNTEWHYNHIFEFCDIKFRISDFETYFEKEYQNKDTIERLFINPNALTKLCKETKNTFPKKQIRNILSRELTTIFEVKLSDFINNDENYNILNDIGMIKYVNCLIQNLKEKSTTS